MLFRKAHALHISEYPGHKHLSLQTEPSEFLNPEYVYVPLTKHSHSVPISVNGT